jgi:hypothetical protein
MPPTSVVQVAIFAAGAALGATAAALAQRRNDRLTVPVAPRVSTSAIPRNTEISRIPVVEVSPTGEPGLAQFQGGGSEVLKHGNPGESVHPFICRSRSLAWIETAFVLIFLRPNFFNSLPITCLMRVQIGPTSDLISRKAYVTAYDRRLRHPAWVSLAVIPKICLTQGSRPPST